LPEIKQQILEMTLNGRGIRDIARVLHISPTTVIEALRKEPQLQHVNDLAIQHMDPSEMRVEIQQVEEAEVDEMWSVVGKKAQQRWLWHAIDHRTGVVFAYVVGTHQDDVFFQWKALWVSLGLHHFSTAGADVYSRHLDPGQHTVGKTHTQKIERKHLTLRTRLKRFVRKIICFSKSMRLHDIVIGLFVNRYEFGMLVWKRETT
jgi:insertion element IS1 protein InsB